MSPKKAKNDVFSTRGGSKIGLFLALFGGIFGPPRDPPVPRLILRPPRQGGGNVLKQGGGILENRSILSRGEKHPFFTLKKPHFWPPHGGLHNLPISTLNEGSGLVGHGSHIRGAYVLYLLRCFFNRRFDVSHEYQFYFFSQYIYTNLI